MEQHPQREKRMGPKGLRWKLRRLCSAGSSSQREGCQHQQSSHTRASRAMPAQGTAEASLKTGLDLWAARGSLSAGGRDLKPKYNWRVRLVLHSSHPSKCPIAALKNCCSKVYFQHRNKQCDSIPQKWDPCSTNRKLSTVVL